MSVADTIAADAIVHARRQNGLRGFVRRLAQLSPRMNELPGRSPANSFTLDRHVCIATVVPTRTVGHFFAPITSRGGRFRTPISGPAKLVERQQTRHVDSRR